MVGAGAELDGVAASVAVVVSVWVGGAELVTVTVGGAGLSPPSEHPATTVTVATMTTTPRKLPMSEE